MTQAPEALRRPGLGHSRSVATESNCTKVLFLVRADGVAKEKAGVDRVDPGLSTGRS